MTESTSQTTVQVLRGREVPLGGVRALEVRRTLPHRDRSFIGAWCFVDHYGPTRVVDASRDGMDVPPHPHTGLQTVSWLFAGEIEHRDSNGVHAMVRPGEVNLMTSGRGIAHSEVSTPATSTLHGLQLWVALPEVDREMARDFQHHVPTETELADGAGTALVFIGELPGVAASPVRTQTPLLGAELRLAPGAEFELTLDPGFEHAFLVDSGTLTVAGQQLGPADLGCIDPGPDSVRLQVGSEPARVALLGGTPFTEEIVMWWNLIGRTHEEVVAAREEYELHSERFGEVPGYEGPESRIPAPPLPTVRLRPRNRRGRVGG
ncbi:pirin [Enemella evansiae]|uniref:pirin family protein n=1 Tax=Enemella evansiae TaxID=2016499 RepID=UPI000B967029|nr:pirin family protein [Enemella evansiae]OYO18207.1 pirin [Enemella evansiae]